VTPPRKKTRVTFWSARLECDDVIDDPETFAVADPGFDLRGGVDFVNRGRG